MRKLKMQLRGGHTALLVTFSAATTLLAFLLVLVLTRCAPFGDNTLVCHDAYYQYLDYFGYLKDLLSGKTSPGYSFSIGMGQSDFAFFFYYLCSPVNLLLLLFDKAHMHDFFNIAVSVKLAIAAGTMAYYLRKRFARLDGLYVYILAMGYGLMQYNIAQSSNIMWLDGVYMLPLMMLGVYEIIRHHRWKLLAVSTAIAIVLEWYIAGDSCLMTGVWFFLEWFLYRWNVEKDSEEATQGPGFRLFVADGFRYVGTMLLGILLSMAMFYSNIVYLRMGKGTLEPENVTAAFRGNIISSILSYSIGANSSSTTVALFCGSLAVLGCVALFMRRDLELRVKVLFGCFGTFFLMIFFWDPLFMIFSLLKRVSSYWYRYAYLSIFALIFMGAFYYATLPDAEAEQADEGSRNGQDILKAALLFSVALFALNYAKGARDQQYIYITAICMIATGLAYAGRRASRASASRVLSVLASAALILVSLFELSENAKVLIDTSYHKSGVATYETYVEQQQEQAAALLAYDTGNYRVSQITNRTLTSEGNTTVNYNEAMAYGYYGLSTYTSCPDNTYLNLLNRMGYGLWAADCTVINTSILPTDSLLGVKYLLSSHDVRGWELADADLPTVDTKQVYVNPHAFPLVYTADPAEMSVADSGNPFDYVNGLYSSLLGRDVQVFVPVETTREDGTNEIKISIASVDADTALYARLVLNESTPSMNIDVNGAFNQVYAIRQWPDVFRVPVDADTASSPYLTIKADEQPGVAEVQVCRVDMEVLAEAARMAQDAAADVTAFTDGRIVCDAVGTGENVLLTSVPYEPGWKITVNGVSVTPQLFGDALIAIPLNDGENHIEMNYRTMGSRTGLALTLMAIVLMILIDRHVFERLFRRKR